MTTLYIACAILVGAAVSFAMRALPFAVFSGSRTMPAWLDALGQMLPPAVMAVLIVYCYKDVPAAVIENGLPKLIAGVLVALSYLWKHNTFVSIFVGTASYMLLLRLM